MTPRTAAPTPPPSRGIEALDWLVVALLVAALAVCTLGLGGFPAEVMTLGSGLVTAALVIGAVRCLMVANLQLHVAALVPVPFLLFALASVLWIAPARWLAWGEWLLWFQVWLVFVLVLHGGRGVTRTSVLVGTLALLGLICVVLAAYQRLVDHSWLMLGRTQALQFRQRSSGAFGIPNSLACFLNLMIPCCLTVLLSRAARPSTKVIAAWLAGLFLVGLALTASRGGWIALALTLLIWPVAATRRWKRKLVGTLVVIAAVVGGLWFLYQQSEVARNRLQPFIDGRFELSRPVLWNAAVALWRDALWLGTGAASYDVLFERVRPRGFQDDPLWTHNDYLNVLSDYGAVGFLLWAGAGLTLAFWGWRAVAHARRTAGSAHVIFERGKWKLGLWLGLLAFALHLVVDFHFRIPALAFAAAVIAGLLLRDDPALQRPVRRGALVGPVLILTGLVVALGFSVQLPFYRGEALRQAAERPLRRQARTGEGRREELLPTARALLAAAVTADPGNGRAWADLASATIESFPSNGMPRAAVGRFAELAANRAIVLCPVEEDFWLLKALALDLQLGRNETEDCYRRATVLAPNSARVWWAYAMHLQRFPERRNDALRAVETCLALDPYYGGAESLRQQLVPR